MADLLNERLLPDGYFAEEHAQLGPRVEIDVATFEDQAAIEQGAGAAATTALSTRVWTPTAPPLIMPAAFPESFEVLVFDGEGGAKLVAAIELVSPGNKDRATHRRAFAVKCASYLCRGIGLVVVDIVTSRQANLHNLMLEVLEQGPEFAVAPSDQLYAVAYRPIIRDQTETIEIWPHALAVGQSLPVVPLAIRADLCLPLDLDATYETACQRRRLV
jgi:hypothetical protein